MRLHLAESHPVHHIRRWQEDPTLMKPPRRWRAAALAVLIVATTLAQLQTAPAQAARKGTVTEFPVPSSAIGQRSSMTAGPDGNIWWISEGSFVNRATTAGAVTQFAVPGAAEPGAGLNDIAIGPDGNVWYLFASDGVQRIGMMTTAGTVLNEYPLAAARPSTSLTSGSDGNLWVLYRRSSISLAQPNVAKVTTSGVITYYTMATLTLSNEIVAGPAGKLWFVDKNNGTSHSFSPADPVGTFASYSTSGAWDIAPGGDGNVWVPLDGSFPGVGRITPDGSVIQFPIPDDPGPRLMTLGPDGNMWFPGQRGGVTRISRITADGKYEAFPLPGGSISTLGAGPDGAVWYARNPTSGPVIGRVETGDRTTGVVKLASGFSLASVRAPGPGTAFRFANASPTAATFTDTTGLALYDSGSQAPGSVFTTTFGAAGTYTYADTLQPAHTGIVVVPPTANPRQIQAHGVYVVEWAKALPPAGFVYDVQRQLTNDSSFADYRMGTTLTNITERTFIVGSSAYRARLRRTADNVATGWSPEVRVRVSGYVADFDDANCSVNECAGTDVAVYRPSTGQWFASTAQLFDNPTPIYTYEWGAPGDIPVPGDYNAEGSLDVAVYRPSTGIWFVKDIAEIAWGNGTDDLPVPADYDNDGRTDPAVYRPSTGTWFLLESQGTNMVATHFGVSTDIPVPADFDGDGKADVAVWRPSTGTWFVLRSSDGALTATAFGVNGDVPLPADYDGDGLGDLAVWRPSTGGFLINKSSGPPSAVTASYFSAGDLPVPGDYDGDGITDTAAYRPSTGVWNMRTSGAGEFATPWGAPGDLPLPLPPAIVSKFYAPAP